MTTITIGIITTIITETDHTHITPTMAPRPETAAVEGGVVRRGQGITITTTTIITGGNGSGVTGGGVIITTAAAAAVGVPIGMYMVGTLTRLTWTSP